MCSTQHGELPKIPERRGFTAKRTDGEWSQLRAKAEALWAFSTHCVLAQIEAGRVATLEHPPHAYSWRTRRATDLRKHGLQLHSFPSCAFGHKDPVSLRPYLKRQRFGCNVSLQFLCRKCVCPKPAKPARRHEIVRGNVQGMRRTCIAGQYPPKLADALAEKITEQCRLSA